LSEKIREVVFIFQNLSENQLNVNKLYAKVMKTEGFNESILGDAFDNLVQNEVLIKIFME
jgi:hypothetical protein